MVAFVAISGGVPAATFLVTFSAARMLGHPPVDITIGSFLLEGFDLAELAIGCGLRLSLDRPGVASRS